MCLAPTNSQVIFHRTPEPTTFPGAPSKPQVENIGERSIKLSWKANSNHGASPVYAYTVEYFSHETGEVRYAETCQSSRYRNKLHLCRLYCGNKRRI